MGHVDALKMVDHVRTRLVDLAVSENYFRDRRMSEAARKVWEGPGLDGGLVSELWVEGAFPGEHSPDCLDSLSDEGLFPGDLCQHLADRDVFPSDRRLYNHQSEAFRAAASSVSDSRTALVITAGTGLGKTEAFLLPMLRDLWTAQGRRPEGGMRCLILYPMNALVSDQVDRIYGWLQGQERLSVFHFTSETPEDARRANKAGVPKWERCRMRTRQEARGFETHDGEKNQTEPFGPVPDIVITNYSMLEYMLCRPQDYRFFGPDLRCIILDEAHLYTGALAAEITMLLRRVRQRCGVAASSILHLATSATLGGDDEDLLGFASTLFSTEQDSTRVIRGRTADLDLGEQESPPKSPAGSRDISAFADLSFNTLTANDTLVADDSNTVEKLKKASRLLVSEGAIARAIKEYPATPACFLHTALREAPLVRKVAIILGNNKSNVLSLDELAGRLFVGQPGEVERKASIALLRLAASARLRPVDMPLVPHRLHFLVRAPEGLSVCLNPDCSGPEERRVLSIGCLQPYGDRCRYCEHILLPVHRCDNCGNWALAAHENQENVLEPGYYAQSAEERTYYLLTQAQDSGFEEVVVNPERGYIRGHGAAGVSLWKAPRVAQEDKRQKCPTCQSVWGIAVSYTHLTLPTN